MEERVEQIKAKIAGFKLRYSYLYSPGEPTEKPQHKTSPVSDANKLDSIHTKLLSKN